MGFVKTIKKVLKKMFSSRKQTAAETVSQLNSSTYHTTETHKCPELYPCLVCVMTKTAPGSSNRQLSTSHKCPELYPCLVCLLREDCASDDASQTDVSDDQYYRTLEKSQKHEALRQFFARRGRKFVPKLH